MIKSSWFYVKFKYNEKGKGEKGTKHGGSWVEARVIQVCGKRLTGLSVNKELEPIEENRDL
ncbi:hypothetical protein EYF80_012833 [Liparis tanakae]|uniref:Uncharacterized protein n=1 Tax=Liparis tanakae TaxID=230148 RepID=A0A4Z2IGQ6_9TELE|nr:hypothetical protein EYF80_012833 [Liparis tanakae]